jgi:hypothetical protein
MAGSWNHSIEHDENGAIPGGKLLCNEDAVQMLENGGDWYEYAEEVYGMVWWLATMLSVQDGATRSPAELIDQARKNYQEGIALSPGTDGRLSDDDE